MVRGLEQWITALSDGGNGLEDFFEVNFPRGGDHPGLSTPRDRLSGNLG